MPDQKAQPDDLGRRCRAVVEQLGRVRRIEPGDVGEVRVVRADARHVRGGWLVAGRFGLGDGREAQRDRARRGLLLFELRALLPGEGCRHGHAAGAVTVHRLAFGQRRARLLARRVARRGSGQDAVLVILDRRRRRRRRCRRRRRAWRGRARWRRGGRRGDCRRRRRGRRRSRLSRRIATGTENQQGRRRHRCPAPEVGRAHSHLRTLPARGPTRSAAPPVGMPHRNSGAIVASGATIAPRLTRKRSARRRRDVGDGDQIGVRHRHQPSTDRPFGSQPCGRAVEHEVRLTAVMTPYFDLAQLA